MNKQYNDFEHIWRLQQILKGMKTPYYTIDNKGNNVLFKYHRGYETYLKKTINELLEIWNKEHP